MAADDERIAILDQVPRADVRAHVEMAHAVVVPSLWECWPNTAREALMVNRPLIATPVGGLTELAQAGRSGVLLADTTAEALIEKLERCMSSPQRELGRMVLQRGPRAVFDELTDPELFVERYRRLAAAPARRPKLPAHRVEPLVSIVIPYFRLEKLVEETLRSALAQTYGTIEIILVVDGSLRDEDAATFDLGERLGVTVVTQVNSGLGAARNFGIGQSRGAYILPLDADDRIEPDFRLPLR